MSSLDEAFMNPLDNMNGVVPEMPNNTIEFYAKVISEHIWTLFYMKDGPYDQQKMRQMKFIGNDYKEYKLECWKVNRIKSKFKKYLFGYLEKKGFYVSNANVKPIVNGVADYILVGDDYEKMVFILGPYSSPVMIYPKY